MITRMNIHCESCNVRSHSFFKTSDPEEMEFVNAHKSCQHFKKGQVVFYEGNRPLGLYCMNSGKVKVYKTGFDGKEQIIHFAQPGDFLGYRALIAEESYPVSAEAIEDTVACFIPEKSFNELLDRNKNLSRQLMKSLCHELNIASERLTSMAQKNVRERLAETLLLLHDTFNADSRNDETIHIVLPREDIANIVGTATETVIRLLSEFKDDRLIEFEGKRIRIMDRKKLERLSMVNG